MAQRKTTSKKSTSTSTRSASATNSMSSARKNAASGKTNKNIDNSYSERHGRLSSIVLFAIGLFITLVSLIKGEALWQWLHDVLLGLFGISAFVVGPIFIYVAILIALNKSKTKVRGRIFQSIFAILLISGATHIFFVGKFLEADFLNTYKLLFETGLQLKGGGVMSIIFAYPLLLTSQLGASIIIILIAFVYIMLVSKITLIEFLAIIAKPFVAIYRFVKQQRAEAIEEEMEVEHSNKKALLDRLLVEHDEQDKDRKFRDFNRTMNTAQKLPDEPAVDPVIDEQTKQNAEFFKEIKDYATPIEKPLFDPIDEAISSFENDDDILLNQEDSQSEAIQSIDSIDNNDIISELNKKDINNEINVAQEVEKALDGYTPLIESYKLPTVDLLNPIVHSNINDNIEEELEKKSKTLVDTLNNFGVKTKIVGISRGPSVTRYEIQPAAGVKISKITSLVDDITLNLATAGVRIEAPIPNKPAVGIEVPNKNTDVVSIREMLDSKTFMESKSHLTAVLGKDISGEIITADIAKMPHMLIAGTTGSGKSVCVNSIIMSILFKSTPDEVRFLMIDPKAVEFMIYNGIPHLLIPVVTDPKKASGALAWAVTEMLNRYKMFSENNVRDLSGYNELANTRDDLDTLPQIVIFIDELADLMMAAPGEVEDSIFRLAQMARAAGMHLVIATQRPSVNVVTGVIKANIPSRIALKVASQVDSRTILDSAGAEKLLGKGDMLFYPVGMPKPLRVQGCWVSDKEVDRVVEYIKNSFNLEYDESVMAEIDKQAELVGMKEKDKAAVSDDFGEEDERLEDAIDAVIEAGQASTSYLQRKLKLGYGRAARLIDIMEQKGIVGPYEGSKPRQVLMTRQEWNERKLNV